MSHTFTRHIPDSDSHINVPACTWILHNYRGSVIGLEPFGVWKWTTFDDSGYGMVRHGSLLLSYDHGTRVANKRTPYLDDAYTLEIGELGEQIVSMQL